MYINLISGGLSLGREAQSGGQRIQLDQLDSRRRTAEAGCSAAAERRRAATEGGGQLGRHAQRKQGTDSRKICTHYSS